MSAMSPCSATCPENSLSIWWSMAQAVLEMGVFLLSGRQKPFLTCMSLILFCTNVSCNSPHHSKEFHSSAAHFMKNTHLDSLSLTPASFVRKPPVQTQKETVSHYPQLFQQFSWVWSSCPQAEKKDHPTS